MNVRRLLLTTLATAMLAGCGDDPLPMQTTTPDSGTRPPPRDCPPGPNVCACADMGPPDFSGATAGMPSETSDMGQMQALERSNYWRTAAGLAPIHANAQLEQAAVAHSTFMAMNPSSCYPGAHNEVQGGCMGFTGASPGARITAAGYRPAVASEVINWNSSVNSSIDGWIWTVYHRTPFQDPGLTEAGFGSVRGGGRLNNTMDFGRPSGTAAGVLRDVSVFPPPGTTYVPAAFQGNLEGPTPPVPRSTRAWPSGQVITLMFPSDNFTIESHHLYDGSCTEVVHSTFIAAGANVADATADANNRNRRFVFLYADRRLNANTQYTVEIRGTREGAAWSRVWAFTTSP